jgi:predicted MFS family arabinose efflux permease
VNQSAAAIPSVVTLLAVAGGLGAANLYYSQPLLPSIAVDLGIPIGQVGFLPATTQIGFAIGILAVLPLADMLERRRLIVTMLVLIAAALAIQATAATAAVAFAAALFVGLFGVAPQLMTPFSAVLAPKGREGAAVGMVLSGILGGVLVSKLLAGFVAAGAGWRTLYWAASAVTLVLAAVLRVYLPKSRPAPRPSYVELLRSSARIAIEEPDLRRHALYGGLTFASFMTFWSTYAIDLQDVFGFGPAVAGMFGAVGLAGSVGASIAGRQIDRGRFALICMTAAALMIGGFLILMWGEQSVAWIVIGVLLMDFGAGLSHSANQSSAFALRPEARGRINSVYMSGYFIGGALGTSLATLAYSTGGWRLTCAFGAACAASILGLEFFHSVLDRCQLGGRLSNISGLSLRSTAKSGEIGEAEGV